MSAALNYVRNDIGGSITVPLHIGRSNDRQQVTLAKGINAMPPEAFKRFAGRRDDTGAWRDGAGSAYINADRIVVVGKPPAKDPVHMVQVKPGVTVTAQSRRAREREAREAAQTASIEQQGQLMELLARQHDDEDTRRARAEAEQAEAAARKAKAEAELAEAEARKAAAISMLDGGSSGGLDPSEHSVADLRELVGAASLDEILAAIKIEKARDGGPRKGALSALVGALES